MRRYNLILTILPIIFNVFLFSSVSLANELLTNAAYFVDAPKWLTSTRVKKVVDRIQQLLEWDIHRVEVYWYTDQTIFEKKHSYGPTVLAFSRKQENSVYIGPKITEINFDGIFGHELVHVISFQKYKEAIPKWLEEGLANYLAKTSSVNYAWLSGKPFPKDVHELTHPFDGSEDNVHYHYMASQALIEMIAKKCDLRNLLRLSVGSKMDGYLETYCQIKDLNAEFQKWVKSHSSVMRN